jgi:hypothetical protein
MKKIDLFPLMQTDTWVTSGDICQLAVLNGLIEDFKKKGPVKSLRVQLNHWTKNGMLDRRPFDGEQPKSHSGVIRYEYCRHE